MKLDKSEQTDKSMDSLKKNLYDLFPAIIKYDHLVPGDAELIVYAVLGTSTFPEIQIMSFGLEINHIGAVFE